MSGASVVGLPVWFADDGAIHVDMTEADHALREENTPRAAVAFEDRYAVGSVWLAVRFREDDLENRSFCECGAPVLVWYVPAPDEEVEPRSSCANAFCSASDT